MTRSSSTHRWAAVLISLAVLITLTGAMPAAAAPKARLDLLLKNYTVSQGSAGSPEQMQLRLFADRTVALTKGAAIRLELSGKVPGVRLGEATYTNNCRLPDWNDLTLLLCQTFPMTVGPAGTNSALLAFVSADATAVPGSVDTVTATMTVPGYPAVVRTARIQVGERVELTTEQSLPTVAVVPGAPFDANLTIRNAGIVPVRGAALSMDSNYAFESRTQFSNCWYRQNQATACLFDQTLEPATGYRFTVPYRLRADTYAPSANYGSFSWLTRAEFDDYRAFVQRGGFTPLGTAGKGGVLRLEQVAAAKAAAPLPQADPTYTATGLQVTATGKQGTDLAAVGARASGRAGAVVKVRIGVHNNGPAAYQYRDGVPVASTVFVVPKGTTAVEVPDACSWLKDNGQPDTSTSGRPGAARYFCRLDGLVHVGTDALLTFGLRIDQVIASATGTIAITQFKADLKSDNNTAVIVLNAPGVPSGGGSGPGGEGSEGGGGGGGLPITGPQGAVFGAVGALLIVGGVLVLLLTRRRPRADI